VIQEHGEVELLQHLVDIGLLVVAVLEIHLIQLLAVLVVLVVVEKELYGQQIFLDILKLLEEKKALVVAVVE
jgi:hypothetical protein